MSQGSSKGVWVIHVNGIADNSRELLIAKCPLSAHMTRLSVSVICDTQCFLSYFVLTAQDYSKLVCWGSGMLF